MRSLTALILAAICTASALAQLEPMAATMASPEEALSYGGLQEAKFHVPSHVVDGWYVRGDAEAEAENLEYFLRALIWGPSPADHEVAMAGGKMIDVDFNLLQVDVRESPENVERIGNTIDPGLEPFLRRRALAGPQGTSVGAGISQLPADAGAGLIVAGPTRSQIARENAAAQRAASSSSGGRYTRHNLHIDDDLTRGNLRVTLVDLYEDRENNDMVTAVLFLQSPEMESEEELIERRRLTFDQWTIRFEEYNLENETITLEVSDL